MSVGTKRSCTSIARQVVKRECGASRQSLEESGLAEILQWTWQLSKRFHPLSQPLPLFGLGFSPRSGSEHLLSVVDEDGNIMLLDTRDENPCTLKLFHFARCFVN
jgi:hypothetical protein